MTEPLVKNHRDSSRGTGSTHTQTAKPPARRSVQPTRCLQSVHACMPGGMHMHCIRGEWAFSNLPRKHSREHSCPSLAISQHLALLGFVARHARRCHFGIGRSLGLRLIDGCMPSEEAFVHIRGHLIWQRIPGEEVRSLAIWQTGSNRE
jgi:hypothetical protein